MTAVVVVTLAGAALAVLVYLVRERLGLAGAGLAALRAVAFGALVVALFNPARIGREGDGSPVVLLDASLSMGAAGGRWAAALDSARALVREGGVVLRFGAAVARADTGSPSDGASRLGDALRVAAGMDGPVHVITDGEIDDAASIAPSLWLGAGVTILPRDTVPNAALIDVDLPDRVVLGDSVAVRVAIATSGGLPVSSQGRIEVSLGSRRLAEAEVPVPDAPGNARRTVWLPEGVLPDGEHALRVRLSVEGDDEPGDDERWRVVTVTSRPGVVVVVDPADIEGRFLMREVREIVRSGARGFARIQDDRWMDMVELTPVSTSEVRGHLRDASLVIARGDAPAAGAGRSSWSWPAAPDGGAEFFEGDWYVTGQLPPSPLAGRLAAVAWDSLPPLSGIVPVVPGDGEWVVMSGRAGRRGADRPLLVGHDSAGTRHLAMEATGAWRWALRGGASLEAYRTLLAAGIDWLLASGDGDPDARMTATTAVSRGRPVVFTWRREDVPDSAVVTVAGPDSTHVVSLRFDARREARHDLPPGVYRWSLAEDRGTGGLAVVEAYSDEYQPSPVSVAPGAASGAFSLIVSHARETWWIFTIAMLAFIAEWGWRQRRGLP